MATWKRNKLLISFVVFTSLSLVHIVDSRVFSKNNNEDFEFINLARENSGSAATTVSRRTRRGASGPSEVLNVTISHLTGANYNEAIVRWSGSGTDGIFVLTRLNRLGIMASTLWRSTDYGSSFNEVKFNDNAVINMFYPSKVNYTKLVFTDVKNQLLYWTDNEAVSPPTAVQLDFTPDKILFHPKREDWLLAYSFSTTTLYVSLDLGKNWSVVHRHVSSDRFFWGVAEQDVDFYRIHMEVQDPKTGLYHHMRTTSPYMEHETIYEELGSIDPNSLLIQDKYMFAQKTTGGRSSLYVSYNRAPYKRARFPGKLHPKNFMLLNSDENQVFLAVDHMETNVHLYVSDEHGLVYTQTLDNVVALVQVDGTFMVDLHEVEGIKGTYICNHYVNSKQVTKITYNKGGIWTRIKAPSEECKAENNCYLNLHMWFSRLVFYRNPILTEENAPGLIIAQGMEGPSLLPSESSLYISNDNGVTWNKVFEGEYKVSLIDHGAAMVAIKENTTSDSLMYSCTEGSTWKKMKFTDQPLHVNGLVAEPGIRRQIISIYGHVTFPYGWDIVKLDFGSILKRKCNQDDYVPWQPSNLFPSHCILGEKVTYERRKKTSECYNGEDYERNLTRQPCTCSHEDFECDFGYEKFAAGCQKASWYDDSVPLFECPEHQTYMKTKGYRKIASDKCEGGDVAKQYAPVETPCPIIAPGNMDIVTVQSHMAVTGKWINFSLVQETGSKLSTNYSWKNGSDAREYTVTGFDKASKHQFKFNKVGVYTVSVTAKNKKGQSTASVVVRVEDEIDDINVIIPRGAAVGRKSLFSVKVITDTEHVHSTSGHPHFVWDFGDGSERLLTWNTSISHTYMKCGSYVASVIASNAVSSHFRGVPLVVYAELVTVQLSFTDNADHSFFLRDVWHTDFLFALKKIVRQVLDVDATRLEVSLLPDLPTRADVSILPRTLDTVHDASLDKLSQALIKAVKDKKISILLGGYLVINATSAKVLKDESAALGTSSHIAVYISVPILFVACLMIFLIFLYYKKKMTQSRRYAMITTEPGDDADHLLDEDDDDQLLDISGNGTRRSEAEAVGDPVLMFMSGQGEQDSHTTVKC